MNVPPIHVTGMQSALTQMDLTHARVDKVSLEMASFVKVLYIIVLIGSTIWQYISIFALRDKNVILIYLH